MVTFYQIMFLILALSGFSNMSNKYKDNTNTCLAGIAVTSIVALVVLEVIKR